jgi:hypothetical protein
MDERQVNVLKRLRDTREFLVDLWDKYDSKELLFALRLINREIKRIKAQTPRVGARPVKPKAWAKHQDDVLREMCGRPVTTKLEAKTVMAECARLVARSTSDTYARLREIGLAQNLHAWARKSDVGGWQTMHTGGEGSNLPGLASLAYQGFKEEKKETPTSKLQ